MLLDMRLAFKEAKGCIATGIYTFCWFLCGEYNLLPICYKFRICNILILSLLYVICNSATARLSFRYRQSPATCTNSSLEYLNNFTPSSAGFILHLPSLDSVSKIERCFILMKH